METNEKDVDSAADCGGIQSGAGLGVQRAGREFGLRRLEVMQTLCMDVCVRAMCGFCCRVAMHLPVLMLHRILSYTSTSIYKYIYISLFHPLLECFLGITRICSFRHFSVPGTRAEQCS